MKKMTSLGVMVMAFAMLFGQLVVAQDGGRTRERGQRGVGGQDQQARGQRGRQRGQAGGRNISLMALAAIESVQAEIEMLDDQVEELKKLQEETRGERGGRQGRGQAGNDDEAQEQRANRRAQAAESAKQAEEGLKNILLDHQFERLAEIRIQALGVAALQDEAIAKKLNITAKQKTAMEEATTESRESMREMFQEMRDGGDRAAMQEKMTEFRSETESKIMDVLSAKQKSTFEAMKGESFEIPADALRGGGRRGQRGGGQRGGGRRGGGGQNDNI